MLPNCHTCIDASECKFLDGLFHHPMEERINTKKGITKKTCQVAISKGPNANQDKRICKTH
jgi:hypothetical protein